MIQLAAHEAAAVRAVPLPDSHWCLFLDVDGTLLELAPTPGEVVVDPSLLQLLQRLRAAASGAVALVSGGKPPERPLQWMRINLFILIVAIFLASASRGARQNLFQPLLKSQSAPTPRD